MNTKQSFHVAKSNDVVVVFRCLRVPSDNLSTASDLDKSNALPAHPFAWSVLILVPTQTPLTNPLYASGKGFGNLTAQIFSSTRPLHHA